MTSISDQAISVAKQILELLSIPKPKLSAKVEDEQIVIDINVPDEESGLIIGYHGETLMALQYLIGQIVNNKSSDETGWTRIVININGYRDQRELQLKQMAMNAADRAVATGDEIEMPYLTPAERRIIHMELTARKDVSSFSEGEGRDRRLIISPKKDQPQSDSKQ